MINVPSSLMSCLMLLSVWAQTHFANNLGSLSACSLCLSMSFRACPSVLLLPDAVLSLCGKCSRSQALCGERKCSYAYAFSSLAGPNTNATFGSASECVPCAFGTEHRQHYKTLLCTRTTSATQADPPLKPSNCTTRTGTACTREQYVNVIIVRAFLVLCS